MADRQGRRARAVRWGPDESPHASKQARISGETSAMVRVKLPDGSVKEYHDGISPREIAEGIGKRLAEAAVAATAEGRSST